MNRRTFARLAGLSVAVTAIGACSRPPEPPVFSEIITTNRTLGTLATAMQSAGVIGGLDEGGPYTVFAPRDSAFAALPEGVLDDLLLPENRAALAAVLGAHIVQGSYLATDLISRTTLVTTIDGTNFTVNGFDGIKISGAAGGTVTVVQPDVIARNGVIHVIDGVLLP